jgi:hypothetical protein
VQTPERLTYAADRMDEDTHAVMQPLQWALPRELPERCYAIWSMQRGCAGSISSTGVRTLVLQTQLRTDDGSISGEGWCNLILAVELGATKVIPRPTIICPELRGRNSLYHRWYLAYAWSYRAVRLFLLLFDHHVNLKGSEMAYEVTELRSVRFLLSFVCSCFGNEAAHLCACVFPGAVVGRGFNFLDWLRARSVPWNGPSYPIQYLTNVMLHVYYIALSDLIASNIFRWTFPIDWKWKKDDIHAIDQLGCCLVCLRECREDGHRPGWWTCWL